MNWHIITCRNSKKIVPVQQHLFKKYVPNANVTYHDLGNKPLSRWTSHVLECLENVTDEHIIFGLDDFLPIDHFPDIKLPTMIYANDDVNGIIGPFPFDRIELGWGGSRKGEKGKVHGFTLFQNDLPYRVSCQFSIWNVTALKAVLSAPRSPWQFETQCNLKGHVMGLQKPWRYIEESAISARQQGKVNLCGLRLEDITELIDLKLVNPEDIVYGWAGDNNRTKESYGTKYKSYY